MRSSYFHYETRSIINILLPGEHYPGYTISRVSVLPPHRGKGIARALMRSVLKDADAEGAVLFLDVQPDISGTGLDFDELYAWYKRCGFVGSLLGYPAMMRTPQLMGQNSTLQDVIDDLKELVRKDAQEV